MSDSDWEVADARPDASLSHRSCPWGGHLIKIDLKMPGYDPPVGRQTWLEKSKVPQVDTSSVFCAKNMCHRSFSEVAIPPVTIPPFAHFRGKPARFCVGCAFGFTFFLWGLHAMAFLKRIRCNMLQVVQASHVSKIWRSGDSKCTC